MKKKSYYDILQVSSTASPEVISSSYKTIMTKLKKHPDLGGSEEEAKLINEAHETLINSDKRKNYDLTLSSPPASNRAPIVKQTPKNTVDNERRRAPRRDVNSTVSFCVGHDFIWHPARVKDISVLGMKLQSTIPLGEGDRLVIAPSNLASIAIHGTVRWQRMFHPSKFERVYEAGIEFADQIQDIDERIL